jgi:iron complex outermembrane receptor protein
MRSRSRSIFVYGAAISALLSAPAFAQSTTDQAKADDDVVSEIVVTGTLIRGVAPVGTNVIGVDEAKIKSIGALTNQQVLAQIPAVSSQIGYTPTTTTGIGATTQRPNIRNLGSSGGNTTLILVDGHNMVGAGILMTTPDSNMLPPSVLQRVEVMADGGSSLYGADAVGGIINFITRKSFDGVEVSGHYGLAKGGYQAGDVNVIGGTSWSGGSAYLAVAHSENTNLSASKRDWPRQDLRARGGDDYRVATCASPNITVGSTNYAYPDLAAGTRNLCDLAYYSDIVPEEQQDSFFGAFNQELGERVSLHATAYYTDRQTTALAAQRTTTGLTIPQTNPFFVRVAPGTSESVALSFAPLLGDYVRSDASLTQYGVTPTLTVRLGGDWQLNAMLNYGRSKTGTHLPGLNPTALAAAAAGTTTATALNPFNLSQTNASVIAGIVDYGNASHSTQTLTEGRMVADGRLFALPGGDVRAAVGVDLQRQESDAFSVNGPSGSTAGASVKNAHRNVSSVFGQVIVPIVGEANALPLVQALKLDASIRYDDYSDFGSTTNPKIGFTWDVAGGLSLRGNYGTSFNAPSLADTTGAVDSRAQIITVSPYRAPGSPITDLFRPTIVLAGGNPDLKPQTADTWSIGADWKPTSLPGFSAGVTYWNIELKNTIVVAPPGFPTSLFTVPAFQKFVTINPTLAQAQAATAGMFIDGAPNIAALYGATTPYLILDARRKNVGNLYATGLDFNASYTQSTDFGSVFATFYATRLLDRDSEAFKGAGKVDLLGVNTSKLQLSATTGVNWGGLTASATLNHRQGYKVTGAGSQTKTGSFDPINLAFIYRFDESQGQNPGWARGMTLSLNIDNAFNEKVPFLNVSPGQTPTNGSTIGRFFNMGLTKHF